MVNQLANIVVLNQARIVLTPQPWLPGWVPAEVSLLLLFQIGVILLGCALALFALGHIEFERTSFWTRIGRWFSPLLLVGYAAATIVLLVL
jgi:hypothetical protein